MIHNVMKNYVLCEVFILVAMHLFGLTNYDKLC